jgi:dipeptidyl aminopeptidase/acylaminoacyl peptidase
MLCGVHFLFAPGFRLRGVACSPRQSSSLCAGTVMRILTLAILLALGSTLAPLYAQPAKRPMTFEDMMHMKRLGETAVSKDGKWLAYSVSTANLDANSITGQLWLQAIAGGQPHKVAVAKPGDAGLQFSPDGKRILFLSGRSGAVEVWLADFDAATGATSGAKQFTSISTGAENAQWSPDGKSIAFTSSVYVDCPAITTSDFAIGNKCNADRDAAIAANPVKARIFTHLLFRHWDHFTSDKISHLFLVSVKTGAMRDLTPNDPHNVPPDYPSQDQNGGGFAFAPDSKQLAFTENLDPMPAISTHADIFTLDLTDPAARPVKVSTSSGGNFSPAYSPDWKWLAWRSQARAGYESDKFRLMLYDREKRTIRDLLPNFGNWVDEFVWADDSQYIHFLSPFKSNEMLYSIGLKDGDLQSFQKIEGNWNGIYSTALRGHGDEWIVGSLATVERPPEVFVADLNKASGDPESYVPRQVTHLNDTILSQLAMSPMEPFWFTAQDGTKIEGFIVKPPNFDPARKYPVKFLIHGGPEGAWDESWSYRWNPELFAANGYVVVMINPRGSTGYGQAFVEGVDGDWGGKPYTDLMTGLDYAEQHFPYIDKTRECALGASYGGYMADWVLGHTDRFKCIVTHDGMFDPESAYGTTDELWFMEWEFRGEPWDYYGKPDSENPYRKWAPMFYAKNFKTPTLVVHGQLDYRLDLSQGLALFTTLQRLGVPSKMLYFPNEGHWVLKPQDSRLWWKTVNGWVDQWTGKAASSH